MLKHILMPPYLKQGVKAMTTGFPNKIRVIVWDTETIAGKPYTIQLFDGETAQLSYHAREPILHTFVKYVRKRIGRGIPTVIYAHNLDFDFPQLLATEHAKFCLPKFTHTYPGLQCSFDVCSGKMTFGTFYSPEGSAAMRDTYRFVMCSLSKACQDLGLAHQKLPRPPYLGEREPMADERSDFERYAMADVYAEYELALWILDRCRELDVPIPISIAHLASLVFRKQFMPPKSVIAFPPTRCAVDAILAYHGGKNGLYTHAPALYRNIRSYDINSAYPWAMKALPNPIGGEYRQVRDYVDGVPGIYILDGDYDYDTYPIFYDHDFKIRPPGAVTNLCVTAPELRCALEGKLFRPRSIRGWIYQAPATESVSPLASYVEFFYKQKSKLPSTDAGYWIAKYLLNSLYGKFIQTTDYGAEKSIIARIKEGTWEFKEQQFQAGGLFQPFLASMITGAVRARLWEYETRYSALHSSTDSILTRDDAITSKDLGELKHENTGDLLLLRNKLYLHTREHLRWESYLNNPPPTTSIGLYKAALHGFQGTSEDLTNLWKTRKNTYTNSRMIRLKESFKHKNLNLTPFTWRTETRELDVDWTLYTEEE